MLVTATQHPVPVIPGTASGDQEFIEKAPAQPVEVEDHVYYRRRIAAGELIKVKTKGDAKQAAKEEAQP